MTETKRNTSLPRILAHQQSVPVMPAVAAEILRMVQQDEDVGLHELAAVIERDPALTARLLGLANSAAYNTGVPVTNMTQATSLLGLDTLRTMALSFMLVDSLPSDSEIPGVDVETYWLFSMTRAVAARALARSTRACLQNDAFLCGLFGGLGRIVLATYVPEEYAPLLQLCEGQWPALDDEERALGFCSADVSASLLANWNMPEAICRTVGYMGRTDKMPDDTPQAIRDLSEHLRLAELTAEALWGDDRVQALVDLASGVLEFDMSPTQLAGYLLELESELEEMSEILEKKTPEEPSHARVLWEIREELVRQSQEGTAAELVPDRRREREIGFPQPTDPASRDRLTGLPSFAWFDSVFHKQIAELRNGRRIQAIGLLLVSVDGLEDIVRRHGKMAGDKLLRSLGPWLGRACRKGDLVASCGNDVFAILVPRATPAALCGMCERLRLASEKLELELEGMPIRFTFSIGGACAARCEADATPEDLWNAASACMTHARGRGGGKYEVSSEIRLRAA